MNTDQTHTGSPIERAMLTIQRQALRAVSPWVQRALARTSETFTGGVRFTSLNSGHMARIVQRSNRHADNGIGLKTHLGSLEPRLISRFSNTISDRFLPLATRHESQSNAAANAASERLDMPLAEGASMADRVGSESEQSVLTQYPTQFGAQPGAESPDTGLQRSFEYSVPETPTVQRTTAPGAPQPRTIQEIRDLLERNLSARRGQSQEPPPVVSNVPAPSPSTVRRVARVEEFDPIAMAMRNEMRAEKPPEEKSPGALPADGPGQIEQPTVQRKLEGPRVPRQAPSIPPTPDISQQLPSIRNDLVGPNGEFSPLQRIRQARASQLQRVQATERRESPPTTETSGLPAMSTSSPASPTVVARVPGKPSRSAIQRRVTEITTPQSAEPDTAPLPQAPAEQTESRDSILPVQSEQADSAPQISRAITDSVPEEPAAPIPTVRPVVGPQSAIATTVPEQPVRPSEAAIATDTNKPAVQRKATGDDAPPQTEATSDLSLPGNQAAPSPVVQEQVQRKPVQPAEHNEEPQSDVESGKLEPQAIQRSQKQEPLEPFAEHIVARATSHQKMPITQRSESAVPVQRQVDTARESLAVHAKLPSVRQDAESTRQENPSSDNAPPAIELQASHAQHPIASGPIQRSTNETDREITDTPTGPAGSPEAESAPVPRDILPSRGQGADVRRKPASAKTATQPKSVLPPHTSGIQRQSTRSESFDTSPGTPHTILPQVQAALLNTAGVLDAPRVTSDAFTLHRAIAPERAHRRSASAQSLPLLQRSVAEGRLPATAGEMSHDIERISPVVTAPAAETLVMRKTKPTDSGKDANTDKKKTDTTATAKSEAGESGGAAESDKASMPDPPDINQLARDILPLIKRMLTVERERIRGN